MLLKLEGKKMMDVLMSHKMDFEKRICDFLRQKKSQKLYIFYSFSFPLKFYRSELAFQKCRPTFIDRHL
jgi:hypothetical protein